MSPQRVMRFWPMLSTAPSSLFATRWLSHHRLNCTAEPGEPLPEPLAKLDPLLIENVCNEVMDSGGQLGALHELSSGAFQGLPCSWVCLNSC